jgi:hypothetical protein
VSASSGTGATAPTLLLGPLLRYVGETEATVWAETDRPCRVGVLGHQAPTFEVAGHHYALVVITGLQPGSSYEYQVTLDGRVCWPEPGSPFPPSVLRTLAPGQPLRLAFGSCRVADLPAPPRGRRRARHEAEHGQDALIGCAAELREAPPGHWPDLMLLIGDQVYADHVGPAARQFISQRRDPARPPGYQAADFGEFCFLYREAWAEPSVRWLLSVIPTAMIFDDHDVHDDWNISAAWCREYHARPWWQATITGAFLSYWLYQHLGNLSPSELAASTLWRQVRDGGDATAVLEDFAARAARGTGDMRWGFQRTLGTVRVAVIDSRASRVLSGGTRLMAGEREWDWFTRAASGDWDHLVLVTSLPLLLPRGIHALEAWNEAVCGGAWGQRLALTGERLRRAADLEHWAAFGESFRKFGQFLTEVATGARGRPPACVTVLSGDVHNSYLAAVDFPAGPGARSAVYQVVCSPLHNVMPARLRRYQRLASSRGGELIARLLARLAGVPPPGIRWRITAGPWFANMIAVLEFRGRAARIRFQRTSPAAGRALDVAWDTRLSPP